MNALQDKCHLSVYFQVYMYRDIYGPIYAISNPHLLTIYFPKYLNSFLFNILICFPILIRLLLFHCMRSSYPHALFIISIYTVNTNVEGESLRYRHAWSTIAPMNGDILSRVFTSFPSSIPNNPSSLKNSHTSTAVFVPQF